MALLADYQVCAASESNSTSSIAIVSSSIRYLEDFLLSEGLSDDVRHITHLEIRAFILHLRQKRCFEARPTTHPQEKLLSGHTINTYLRSIRIFFSRLLSEDIIGTNPFEKVKIPYQNAAGYHRHVLPRGVPQLHHGPYAP